MAQLTSIPFHLFPAAGVGKDDRIDALGSQAAITPREEAGRRFATQVTLATLGLPANWDREWYHGYFIPTQTPAPERNELAEREDADTRRKFPWRFGDWRGKT